MEELLNKAKILQGQLKRQMYYAFNCEKEADRYQRLWWRGYIEALDHVISLIKEVTK